MYSNEATDECKKQMLKLTSKNNPLLDALDSKIKKISENPYRFKPLGNVLPGFRRVHVLRCFVLIYDVDETRKTVVFRRFSRHDEAY